VLVKGTNKFKLDVVKQHESSKPHQYYQSRYISNPTEPTAIVFIKAETEWLW
jgi:hypothetical protein